jgi:hypothetical protein
MQAHTAQPHVQQRPAYAQPHPAQMQAHTAQPQVQQRPAYTSPHPAQPHPAQMQQHAAPQKPTVKHTQAPQPHPSGDTQR